MISQCLVFDRNKAFALAEVHAPPPYINMSKNVMSECSVTLDLENNIGINEGRTQRKHNTEMETGQPQ